MAAPAPSPFEAFSLAAIEQSMPARFEQQAASHPEHLAVRSGTESLNYRQLDQLANKLAHGILARRGEGPEPVGLLMHQGAGLIAAILGILKAGKMYVPMDPSHPPARTAFALEDAGAALIITDRAALTTDPLLSTADRAVVTVEELQAGRPGSPPGLPLSGDTPAYIYYTSGSTGRPKGVFDTHRNVLHNIMRYTNSLRICSSDRLTLLQSPSFSGAVSSLFSALLNGAAVFPYDLAKDGMGRALANWLNQEQITIYHSVPMIFRSILHGEARFPSLRIIRLEGDAASRVDVELFRRYFEPGCTLVNGLGATETGITRQFFMSRDTPLPGGIVPIGFATEGMHATLLDDDGREVPDGTVGQIAIRSRYLAMGYWRRPDLTRAAFLPGPPGSGERIYLTGDLGRLLPDGCLEYLGRKDSGLKIRGNRVEPAEVERALLNLEAIREAAVVARAGADGMPRLVAYLVPAEPRAPVSVLRRGLAQTLPDYMIPTRFVYLDQLPLSENGKVDRKALPAPEEGRLERTWPFVPPRDELETQLVAAWEDVLGLQPLGVTDNFFDLGGDSVAAASLLLSLEAIAGKELPASSVVSAPTIEQLARLIRGGSSWGNDVLVPLRTGGSRPPFFCVVEHGGNVHAGFAAWSRRLADDQPFYALQAAGLGGNEPLLTSIEAMAGRYIDVVRGVQPHGPYYLGGRCFGASVALEMAHQLVAQGEPVRLLFFLDVTPADFPGLTSGSARRRFGRQASRARLGSDLALLRQRRLWKRAPYAVREIGRKAWARGREWLARWYIRLGRSLPRGLRKVSLVNRQAFALYAPRTWPGRVTLVLRAEQASLYDPDPVRDWGRLAAGGYDIHFLEGAASGFSREPQPQMAADLLSSAIAAASA